MNSRRWIAGSGPLWAAAAVAVVTPLAWYYLDLGWEVLIGGVVGVIVLIAGRFFARQCGP